MSSFGAIKSLSKTNIFLSTGRMPRLTITTPNGELVAEHHVADNQVAVVLQKWFWILTSSDVAVAVDDMRVSEEDKQRLMGIDLQPSPVAYLPEPALLAEYASTMHHAFEQVREAQWRATERDREAQWRATERDREAQLRATERDFAFTVKFADELTRQRQMMHQNIRDVDSVDRAIVATNQADKFAARIHNAANAGPTGKQQSTVNIADILHGIREVMNKNGGAPNEQE